MGISYSSKLNLNDIYQLFDKREKDFVLNEVNVREVVPSYQVLLFDPRISGLGRFTVNFPIILLKEKLNIYSLT